MQDQVDRIEFDLKSCDRSLVRIRNIMPGIAFLLMLIAAGIWVIAITNLYRLY